jgi:hypothetical protein
MGKRKLRLPLSLKGMSDFSAEIATLRDAIKDQVEKKESYACRSLRIDFHRDSRSPMATSAPEFLGE